MNDKNLKALFKGLGLPESLVAEIEKDDFDSAKTVTEFHASQKEHYSGIIRNEIESEIKEEVEKSVTGKMVNTFKNDIKKTFGIPIEKLNALQPHEMLKTAKGVIDEEYKKNPGADEIQKLQAEKMEWQNKHSELEGKFTSEVERIRKEEAEKTVSNLGDIDVTKAFTSVPTEKILGKKHSDGIALAVKSDIYSKYKFGSDEHGKPILLEKGTNKRATAKDAGGKEYFVDVNEIVLNSLDTLGFINKSNGGEGSGQGGQGSGGQGQPQRSARFIELQKKAEEAA